MRATNQRTFQNVSKQQDVTPFRNAERFETCFDIRLTVVDMQDPEYLQTMVRVGAAAGIRTRVVGLEGHWTLGSYVLDQARLRPHPHNVRRISTPEPSNNKLGSSVLTIKK